MFGSSSTTTQVQHVMLRCISLRRGKRKALLVSLAVHGIDAHWDEATKIVAVATELQTYLAIVKRNIPIEILLPDEEGLWPGAFKPCQDMQEQLAQVGGIDTIDASIRLDLPRPRTVTTRTAALADAGLVSDSPFIIRGYDLDAMPG
ncbi:hypothetical protein BJY01DRAFT_250527 [Aspergillus pseudoustus]|uniref:Uncharacterized protein n=1 Tax=Aspergillus pseudoustus TaxID=1810923 RepID=A0ABR4JH31_9EURO